ncbi:hypothetical protein EJB05_08645, partial [Eragrostis curvula]
MGQGHLRGADGTSYSPIISAYMGHYGTNSPDNTKPDKFIWKWSSDGNYNTAFAYKAFFHGQEIMRGGKELWKAKAPLKHKFFFWLALYKRCWTSQRLQRHNLPNHGNCALCDQEEESIDHLVLGCVYSKECWFKLLRPSGYQQLMPRSNAELVDWWLLSRKKVAKTARKGFDSLVMLTVWTIWCERNKRIFNNVSRLQAAVIENIREEATLWNRAGNKELSTRVVLALYPAML